MKRKYLCLFIATIQLMYSIPILASALDSNDMGSTFNNGISEFVDIGILYLNDSYRDLVCWDEDNKHCSADISNILEYIDSYETETEDTLVDDLLDNAFSYYYDNGVYNNDDFAKYFLIDSLYDKVYFNYFINSQNPDGGFGLAENYTSDIIDTKLALKALADLGETEAMTKAAIYIASLQNADGGFSYQQGLASDPELTAEIADIFGDCIIKDQSLAYTLSDTLSKLNDYLDANMPKIEDLSENNRKVQCYTLL